MNPDELLSFLKKYDIGDDDFADLVGVGHTIVKYWLTGERKMSAPTVKLIRIFDRYPQLMKEFP